MYLSKYKIKNMILGALYAALLLALPMGNAMANSAAPDPLCVAGDDFGDLIKRRTAVEATAEGTLNSSGIYSLTAPSGWKDTQVDIIQGKRLQIKTYGQVNLCGATSQTNTMFSPSPLNSGWQDSGITIKKGMKYNIGVNGSFSKWAAGTDCTKSSSPYWDASTCMSDKGRLLFVYIGDPSKVTNWKSLEKTPYPPNDTHYAASNPEFFELYNYATKVSGYEFDPKDLTASNWQSYPTGRLYFKYASDSSFESNIDNNYANNRGGYSVSITTYSGCTGNNGEFLVGYIQEHPEDAIPAVTNPNAGGRLINLHKYSNGDPDIVPRGPIGEYNKYSPATGRLWLKVIDSATISWDGDGVVKGDGIYTPLSSKNGSNFGEYTVNIVTDAPEKTGFTNFIHTIIDPVRLFIQGDPKAFPPVVGLTERMYKGITSNVDFIMGARAIMTLAIVFFAFTYMVGLSNITQKELFNLVVKLAIIVTLTSPTSWDFFNTYLFAFFTDGTNDLIRIMTSQFSNILPLPDGSGTMAASQDPAGDTFAFLNATLERFFTKETNIKIAGLLSTFPIGFIMGVMIYIGMAMFIFTVLKALLVYLIAILMTSLLMFLGPIFITFLLFSKTKTMFDKWVKQLMNFSLQPILLFTVLSIFNVFIFSALYKLLSFSVCWGCVFELDLPISEFLFNNNVGGNFDKICMIHGYTPWGVNSGQDVSVTLAKTPIGMFMILIFILLCDAMTKFCDWILEVTTVLVGGGPSLGNTASAAISEATKTAQTTAKTGIKAGLFAAHATGRVGDYAGLAATGGKHTHLFTNNLKKGTRTVIGAVGGRSRTANILLGGHSFRGSTNSIGQKNRWDNKLMTSTEKKAESREIKLTNKFIRAKSGGDAQEAAKLKRDVYKLNQDKRQDYKNLKSDERKAQRELQRNEQSIIGARERGLSGGRHGKKIAEKVVGEKLHGVEGYSKKTTSAAGGGRESDQQRRELIRKEKQKDLIKLNQPDAKDDIRREIKDDKEAAKQARKDARGGAATSKTDLNKAKKANKAYDEQISSNKRAEHADREAARKALKPTNNSGNNDDNNNNN
jgi:type IV secretory pathway VirB6-like protein